MWELYNALIDSVEPGQKLLDLAVGAEWTAVLSEDGGLGLAPTIREAFRRFDSAIKPAKGMDLSELAAAARAWDYYEAALGLAAVNAAHNRPERLPGGAAHRPGGRRSISAFITFCKENLGGKHSLLIDPMYLRENMNNVPGLFDITRRDTTYRDYPSSAYLELVPACDQLIMSGTPLVDKYAEPILKLAARAAGPSQAPVIRFWGIDVPMTSVLKDFSVHDITGFLADDPEQVLWTVKRGGSRDDILRLGHFATITL